MLDCLARRLVVSAALSVPLLACSTGRSSDGVTDAMVVDDRATTADGHVIDGGAEIDAPGSDAGHVDAGLPSDASIDGSAGGAHPPAGYTLCGSGTFNAADVVSACESSPGISGALPYPVDCAGATSMGGRYEIWCPPPGNIYLYFWTQLDQVHAPGTMCSVPWDGGFRPLTAYAETGGARYVGSTGARAGDGDFTTESPIVLDGAPMDVVIDGQAAFGGSLGASGTLDVWIMVTPGGCPDSMMDPTPQYMMGVHATWATPDT